MAEVSRRRWVLLAVIVAVAAGGGGLAWSLWPDDPEPAAAAGDTGLTREQTEEFMRTIGYVQ